MEFADSCLTFRNSLNVQFLEYRSADYRRKANLAVAQPTIGATIFATADQRSTTTPTCYL